MALNLNILGLLLCIFVATLSQGAFARPNRFHNDDWVRVNGIEFSLRGRPFYVHGFNGFWLPYLAQDPKNRPEVSSLLERATALGFNAFRTWGWRNGGNVSTDAWQPTPGQYNSTAMEGLDFVVSEAKRLGLKVVIPFGNNWEAYGGKETYAQWVWGPQTPAYLNDMFFTNEMAKRIFKDYIHTLLNRVNSFTGVKYKNDPTIFSWELLNEPRCDSDPSGNAVEEWINDISAFVKSIDRRHLLSNGAEGFYSRLDRANGEDRRSGTDFIRHNMNPNIDYASAHFYPKWLPWIRTTEGRLQYSRDWIRDHKHDAHVTLQKPLFLGEFGEDYSTLEEKIVLFRDMFRDMFFSDRYTASSTGGCLWVLYSDTMPGDTWDPFHNVVRIGQLERSGFYFEGHPN